MKVWWLTLCGCVLFAAHGWTQPPTDNGPVALPATPGEHPQASPGQTVPLGNPPFLLVYVVRSGDNAGPRIALGLEKPVLKINAFEKCVRVSHANPAFRGVAVELMPAAAKALVAAMKSLAPPGANVLPEMVLWFTTPDDQLLDCIVTGSSKPEANLFEAGVLDFEPADQGIMIEYLSEKLHLR